MDQDTKDLAKSVRQQVRQKVKGAEARLNVTKGMLGICKTTFELVIGQMYFTESIKSTRLGFGVLLSHMIWMETQKET